VSRVIYLGAVEGCEAASAHLDGVADVVHVEAEPTAVAQALSAAVGVLDASMRVHFTDEMIATAGSLKVISCATTGSDHIARREMERRNIPLHTLKEDPDLLRNITPAAELSWALVMALARRLGPAAEHTSAGGWVRERFPGLMLNGRTLGLIGCGRIGGWVARYAGAFGMRVLAYDPFVIELPEGVEAAAIDDVVAEADVLSVHVHLSEDTRGLVSRALLEKCKPGMLFVNTSRGAVVDEAALLEGLRSGRIGGAGLDVLDGEPAIANHPLVAYARDHDNLYITPHCGGFSPDAVRLVCGCAAAKIARVLQR